MAGFIVTDGSTPEPEPEPEPSDGPYILVFATDRNYENALALDGGSIEEADVWIRLNIDQAPAQTIARVEWYLDDALYRDDDLKAPYDLTYMPNVLRFNDWGGLGEHTVTAMVVYGDGLAGDRQGHRNRH